MPQSQRSLELNTGLLYVAVLQMFEPSLADSQSTYLQEAGTESGAMTQTQALQYKMEMSSAASQLLHQTCTPQVVSHSRSVLFFPPTEQASSSAAPEPSL